MQGNEEGVQVPFALGDTMSFAGIRDTGYEKSYTSDSEGILKFKFPNKSFYEAQSFFKFLLNI